ncbi:hypothetical protein C8039_04880 [Halogeometricum sp. wsp3]|nr:hypothetical protein C8039_04880 [Halogeometricum sp. wsp3]
MLRGSRTPRTRAISCSRISTSTASEGSWPGRRTYLERVTNERVSGTEHPPSTSPTTTSTAFRHRYTSTLASSQAGRFRCDTAASSRREHDLATAVRGGGHNGPGLALVDGGLVIDLLRMSGDTRFRA